MQRLYSMFPLGGPGIGLVLLRLALVIALFVDRIAVTRTVPDQIVLPCLIAMSLVLVFGLLTPVVASLGFLTGCTALMHADALDTWVALLILLLCAALLLLGPGAYSLDARIYGRRIVTVRRDRD